MKLVFLNIQSNEATHPLSFSPQHHREATTLARASSTVSLPNSLNMERSVFFRASESVLTCLIGVCSTVALKYVLKRSKPSCG